MLRRGLKKITSFLFLFTISGRSSLPVTDDTKTKNISVTEHLKIPIIQDICAKRDSICSNYTLKLCAVRLENGTFLYREFENDCHLFLTNMCEYPGREWAIKHQIPCTDPNPRRTGNETMAESNVPAESVPNPQENEGGSGRDEGNNANAQGIEESNMYGNGTDNAEAKDVSVAGDVTEPTENPDDALRYGRYVFTTALYAVKRALDRHKCPQHCPDVHSPVCININRGYGKHFQLLHFSNHCEADRHICANINTVYKQPADLKAPASAVIGAGKYSNCASQRYMSLAMFTQTASSMAHYGWLAGPQRGHRIIDPPDRLPGTG